MTCNHAGRSCSVVRVNSTSPAEPHTLGGYIISLCVSLCCFVAITPRLSRLSRLPPRVSLPPPQSHIHTYTYTHTHTRTQCTPSHSLCQWYSRPNTAAAVLVLAIPTDGISTTATATATTTSRCLPRRPRPISHRRRRRRTRVWSDSAASTERASE